MAHLESGISPDGEPSKPVWPSAQLQPPRPGQPLQARPWREIAAARGWYKLAPASFAGVVARATAAESGGHDQGWLQGVGREIRPSSGQMFLEDAHLNAV